MKNLIDSNVYSTIYLTRFLSISQLPKVGVQSEIEPESAIPSSLEDKVNLVLPLQGKDDDEMYE